MAPPNRPTPRELQVLASRNITPNMLRLTLGGPGLEGFPEGQAGGYVKLMLPSANGKPILRTYTIRAQRKGEIDIDFALHTETASGSAGPATEWAMAARIGDRIMVGGPGPAKPLPAGHDFYLLAGDMTALPAISVNLEMLPPDAKGLAVLEVLSEADKQALSCPEGVEIRWLVNPRPGLDIVLPAEARSVNRPAGSLYGWCASEFSTMQQLRAWLRDEQGLGSDRLYISSYWKSGLTEEAHKEVKRVDAEAQAV